MVDDRVVPFGFPAIGGKKITAAFDARAACLVEWVLAHPETNVGLLGNQALAEERNP